RPEGYEDEVRKRIQVEIQKKVEGQEISAAPPQEAAPARVIDLMEALKASLARQGQAPAQAAEQAQAVAPAAPAQAAEAPPAGERKPARRAKSAEEKPATGR